MATVTITEAGDESRQIILPVTPATLEDSISSHKRTFVVIGSGTHSRPVGRDEATFPLTGTLPGESRAILPHVHDWQPPQTIINQIRDWILRSAELRYVTDAVAGFEEFRVYVDSYRFTRNGAYGDVDFQVQLVEWRTLLIRIDDGTESSGDAVASETADEAAAEAIPSTYAVQAGDTLSEIAKTLLGDSGRWREIFDANTDTISDPNVISIGQVLNIPGGTTPPEALVDVEAEL
jgi:hypothetical protein